MSVRPPDAERTAREARGRAAESLAALYLMLRGYRILARRQRTPYGEIDLIARRGASITFVEVKFRRTRAEAEDALRSKQARRVARAANYWISRQPLYADFEQRFDAVLILPWSWPVHLTDAYEPIGTSGPM